MAEIKEGLSTELPDKPEALVLYEQVKDMGIPLVDGGVRDQPHIWMMEYRICDNEVRLMEAIQQAQADQNQDK